MRFFKRSRVRVLRRRRFRPEALRLEGRQLAANTLLSGSGAVHYVTDPVPGFIITCPCTC